MPWEPVQRNSSSNRETLSAVPHRGNPNGQFDATCYPAGSPPGSAVASSRGTRPTHCFTAARLQAGKPFRQSLMGKPPRPRCFTTALAPLLPAFHLLFGAKKAGSKILRSRW
ncbi:hypothetical protein [Calothrix sp. NIES-2098]|uniref:hypothetical protein n=1 Tax=Calothrix sp. NIES-2098 TaxID=1954171 RepID=UPI0030DCF73A